VPVANKGWASVAEADLYFTDERNISTLWTALADDDAKNRVLNMAYNRIFYCASVSVPAAGVETAAQLVGLIIIQAEMAYYLLKHLNDEDKRKGIQAQGVIKAGVVKEDYDKDMLTKIPMPPIVEELLIDAGYLTSKPLFGMIDIDRDENESVDEKVDEF